VQEIFTSLVRDILLKWEMPKKGNICLFKSYYMPILTYGAKIWTCAKAGISRLTAAEMRFIRSMEGNTKRERIRNRKKPTAR
jgi:hypothetical protein